VSDQRLTCPARERDVAVGVAVVAAGAAVTAVRLALLPARMLLHGPLARRQVVRLGNVGISASEQGRRRLEELPGRVADQVLAEVELREAVAAQLDEARMEQLARRVLASPVLEQVLRSPESEHVLEQIAASPAVRAALEQQATGFLEELAEAVRTAAARADERIEARSRAAAGSRYAGTASRAIALGVDAAAAQALYLVAAGTVAVLASLAGGLRPAWLAAALAAVGWLLIVGGYFVSFWTLTGQTPGMRLLRIRLGRDVGVGRSIVRYLALVVSIAPFFAGFASVPLDRKRRGLHDFVAGTEVVRADAHPDGMMQPAGLPSRLPPR
jgi:uncharacterized RDD family membrane protein YckC